MANTIDWGQGAVNNTIDWGKGKTNATNNWGSIYDSTAAGETNITGSGGVTPFVNEYSMSFDGIDERFDVGTTSLGITSAISVSAWVKIPTTNTGGGGTNIQEIICEDTASGSNRNWFLNWRGGGLDRFQFGIWNTDGSSTQILTTGITPNDGNWHHLLATYDGTTNANGLKLYVDGGTPFTATASSTGIRSISSVEATIGALTGGANWFFEGNIDEVAVWNTDQSSNASTIYNSGKPADLSSLSPVSWWRMGDGDTWNGSTWTLTDNGSGGNDATSVNMEEADRLPISPNSYTQNSFSFDGVDEYVDLGDLSAVLSSKTSATVSLWFKRDTTTNQILLDLKDGTSRIAMQLYLSNSIYFYVNNKTYFHPTSPSINQWYNLVYVFNGGGATNSDKLKMYLNGTELTGGTYSGAIDTAIGVFTSSMTSNIGRTPSTAYFNGNIDEVAVWNSDQSSNISTIFNNGIPQDISSLSPISHWRMGESATWNGSIWTLTDQGSGGNNATSVNMEEADKTGDQAYVI